MAIEMFSVLKQPDLFISRTNAEALADCVKAWGYRASIWNTTSRAKDERGFAVAVFSNSGFEGFAHAL